MYINFPKITKQQKFQNEREEEEEEIVKSSKSRKTTCFLGEGGGGKKGAIKMGKNTHYELYLSTIPPVAVNSDPVQTYEVIRASPFRAMNDIKGKAKVVAYSSGDDDDEDLNDNEIDDQLADYDFPDDEDDKSEGLVVYHSDDEIEEEEEEEEEEKRQPPPQTSLSEPVQKIMNSIVDYTKNSSIDFALLGQDLEKMFRALTFTPPNQDVLEEVNKRWLQRYKTHGCPACVELLTWLENGFEQLKFKFDQKNEGDTKLPDGTLSLFTETPIKDTYHIVYLFAHQNLQPNGRFLSNGRMERKVFYLSPPQVEDPVGLGGDDISMIVWVIENFYHAPYYLPTFKKDDALRWYVSILMVMEGVRSPE